MPVPIIYVPFQRAETSTQQAEFRATNALPITIRFRKQTLTLNPRVIRYAEGVTATYGTTVIESDELELHLSEDDPYAIARGHVRLKDPVASGEGQQLEFHWLKKTGHGSMFTMRADSVKAEMGRLVINPDQWDLFDVKAVGYAESFPLITVRSRRGVVKPGESVTMRKPRVGLFGASNIPINDYKGSLAKKEFGLTLPGINYQQGLGLGVAWRSKLLMGKQTVLTGGFGSYPKSLPNYGLALTHSFLPIKLVGRDIRPIDELSDRFDQSYFQNAIVKEPERDRQLLGERRLSLSISRDSNIGAAGGRNTGGLYQKPLEMVGEASGQSSIGSTLAQIRFQSIRQDTTALRSRGLIWVAVAPKPLKIGQNISLDLRHDTSAFSDTGFGWTRLQVGATVKPLPFLRLGAAAFRGFESGTPGFAADRLDRLRGTVLRADLVSGPTKISHLWKFDSTGHSYDREYSLTQAIGILEAFVDYRKLNGDYRWGVRLRLDQIFSPIRER